MARLNNQCASRKPLQPYNCMPCNVKQGKLDKSANNFEIKIHLLPYLSIIIMDDWELGTSVCVLFDEYTKKFNDLVLVYAMAPMCKSTFSEGPMSMLLSLTI